jgi:THO complex subunit 2
VRIPKHKACGGADGADISAKQLRTRLCQQLHQHCFYPRAIQTPGDAIFVPTLIRFMHDIGTPQFTTLFAYSNVCCPLSLRKDADV